MTKLDYIQYLCEKQLKSLGLQGDDRYIQRLERELSNIEVQAIQDYVLTAVKENLTVNSHGSLVYFLLGVAKVDPLETNEELVIKKPSSFPDIDSDFSINEREQVVKYFIEKYGGDHVAPIGSYGQMKMKSVTRDVARIFDIDLEDTNDVVRNLRDDVDAMTEEEFDIAISIEPGEEGFRQDLFDLRQYFDRHPELREIIFMLKGQLRHLTKHPAGVVAVPTKIDETIPLMRHKDILITSWVDGITRKDLQSSGFIKFDILGLKTLTIIKEILELIHSRQIYNLEADFDLRTIDDGRMTSLLYEDFSVDLPLDGNNVVYERFRKNDTNGIFQFECIHGDSWIGNYRMRELYNKFIVDPESVHKIGCYDFRRKMKVRQKIDAMKKQQKTMFRLVVANDRCLIVSLTHRFYTKNGWKILGDLTTKDKVLVDHARCRTQYYCDQSDSIVDGWGTGPKCSQCIKEKRRTCPSQILGKFKKHGKQRYTFVSIKSITNIGICESYDLGFGGSKRHNYVANGFIVHNSALMKSLLKEIRPTTFADITSATALGRPGPLDMGMHKEYAARKNGKSFDFGSPHIEACLKESFGILVYQEDVMRLCHMVAGFPLDLTDTVRKNLMKSIRDTDAKDKAAKQRKEITKRFIKGCMDNGLSKQVAESWWQNCCSFARYGFNKCLTGDTILTRCNGNQYTNRNVTIRELYSSMRMNSHVGRKYRRNGYPVIHAMIDGRIKIDKIKDIIYNGKKPVFKIITEHGFSIKATDIHRFLSEFGWKMLKMFSIGDQIAVTFQEYDGYKQKGYSDRVLGKSYDNDCPGFGRKKNNPAYIDGRSILKYENIQNLTSKYTVCQDCNKPHRRLEVHHKQRLIAFDYDIIKYHDESNMIVLCPSCHKKCHYKLGRTKRYGKGFEVTYDKIVSIEFVDIEDTYDVEMFGDEHNFVANGFISHNSHAVSYTILSYQMMWFKVYYPLEFFVVLFSNSPKEKFTNYFSEAMNKGISIVPVDIRTAKEGFSIHGEDSIMFGLSHIMGVGPSVVKILLDAQPFDSFDEFWVKTASVKKVGKAAMVALINAHAFDAFGPQNEILERYFLHFRREKKWAREVDYEDKQFEHEKFVEAYSLDWRTKLSDDHKAVIKSLGAKLLTKLVQPSMNTKRLVWGVITDIVSKTSKNGNRYYYVFLTDSRFNIVKIRIPCYNRRSKKAFSLNRTTGKYDKVNIDDVIHLSNILVGQAETSEYMGRIFIDLYDICCIGSIYEKSIQQTEKLAKYDKLFSEK